MDISSTWDARKQASRPCPTTYIFSDLGTLRMLQSLTQIMRNERKCFTWRVKQRC